MKNKNLQTILITFFAIAIDLLSKRIFFNWEFAESSALIHPILNTGVSLSLPVPHIIVIPISIAAILGFIWLRKKKHITGRIFVLLCAGTMGNLIDRSFYNGVRDFIVFGNRFIFNIADLFLSIGVASALWTEIFGKKNKK